MVLCGLIRMQIAEIERLTRELFPDVRRADLSFHPIEKGGSGRNFYRVFKEGEPFGVMVMQYADDRPDNARFASVTDFLVEQGVSVPSIRAKREEFGLLWVDDLGDVELGTVVEGDWDSTGRPAYEDALKAVFAIHQMHEKTPPNGLPELEPGFDESLYRWEQDYFFDHYVSNFCEKEAASLREDNSLETLRKELAAESRSLLHRDFQSGNVMLWNDDCYLLDYQGMRWGVPEYDLASLIYDPYVSLKESQREQLIRFYYGLKKSAGHSEEFSVFENRLYKCAVQRLMQALGAYGNLGLNLGKKEFLDHVAPAEKRLRNIAVGKNTLPVLAKILPED